MQTHKAPDPERLHVLTAGLRAWLMDVVVWLAEWLGVRLPREMKLDLRRELARTLADARLLVFLLAYARLRLPAPVSHASRPLSAPRGCRRARDTGGDGRVFRRGMKLSGFSVAARLRALRDLFDNLGAAIARMRRRLLRRWRGLAIVLVAAAAARAVGVAAPAPAGVDSS